MDPSRISLRRFQLSDVDDFLKWASDDKVTRYLKWNTITSREEALSYLEKVAILNLISSPWVCSECKVWGQGIATAALKMGVPNVVKEIQDSQGLKLL
ncbi:hypothetical protein CRYUN_Cryun36dG0057600 [Craigia yunnanensis]